MSKKKTAQITKNHKVNSEASEEQNQMEVTNNVTDEAVPATIVEASEAEIFEGPTEGQDAVVAAEAESQVVEGQVAEGPVVASEGDTQPAEQPAPKPPKASKRPYISLVEEHLELGNLDKKELLALIMERFPTISKNGVSTFLTDALNPKY